MAFMVHDLKPVSASHLFIGQITDQSMNCFTFIQKILRLLHHFKFLSFQIGGQPFICSQEILFEFLHNLTSGHLLVHQANTLPHPISGKILGALIITLTELVYRAQRWFRH